MRKRLPVGSRLIIAALTCSALTNCEDSTGPEFVAEVELRPDSVHLEPGDEVSLSAMPIGPWDQPLAERQVWMNWEVDDPALVTISPAAGEARITAHEIGTALVRAYLGRGADTAWIHVNPPGLVTVRLEPEPILIPRLTEVFVRAVLIDASGERLPPDGFRISWAIDEEADQKVRIVHEAGDSVQLRGIRQGTQVLRLVVGPLAVSREVKVTGS